LLPPIPPLTAIERAAIHYPWIAAILFGEAEVQSLGRLSHELVEEFVARRRVVADIGSAFEQGRHGVARGYEHDHEECEFREY
jgi:hypothetical protein